MSNEQWESVRRSTISCETVEEIFKDAFGLTSFPGWEEPVPGHKFVKGRCNGEELFAVFSFWPRTGKYLFQGKPEEVRNSNEKWDAAYARRFG